MAEKIKGSAGQYLHELRDAGERAWERTQDLMSAAGTRTARYARLVQRRLDLAAMDHKMEGRYRELGRLVFSVARAGSTEVFLHPEIRSVMAELAELEEERKAIMREVESLHAAAPSDRETGHEGLDQDGSPTNAPADEEDERYL